MLSKPHAAERAKRLGDALVGLQESEDAEQRNVGRQAEFLAIGSPVHVDGPGAVRDLGDRAFKASLPGSLSDGFAVRDHGPGLLADDVPHLFDRFYRSVSMRSKPGSGLGLSIVKSMADMHGGSVFASNEHRPDGSVDGARIGFELPLAVSE